MSTEPGSDHPRSSVMSAPEMAKLRLTRMEDES